MADGLKEIVPHESASHYFANMNTNLGSIRIKLFYDEAPKTCQNFIDLAEGTCEWTEPGSGATVKRPYYDGLIFHRVIPRFMIQGGCCLGRGTGGPGYRFADEFHSSLRHDRPGLLSMANAGPNTNGAQFFITTVPTPHLDNRHTIFGEIVAGYDVIEKISATPTARGDQPIDPITIQNLTIDREY